MRPINKRYFGQGAGKLSVSFYDGSTFAEGFIVKQTGVSSFLVSNGVSTKRIQLTNDTTLASILTERVAPTSDQLTMVAGLGTIEVTDNGVIKYIQKLSAKTVTLTNGETRVWAYGYVDSSSDKVVTINSQSQVQHTALMNDQGGYILNSDGGYVYA